VFAQAGANVIDARIHTSKSGQAFDVFALQDQAGAAFGEGRQDAIDRLFSRLQVALDAERKSDRDSLVAANASTIKRPTSRTAAFAIEPVIMIDNEGAAFDTIVEVSGRDRTGLLADLAQVFEDEGLNVTSAHIDGVGERATDAFYLRDRGGLKLSDARRITILKERLMGVLAEADTTEGPSLLSRRKLARARASSRR
jgi:[protein-PII] uridylyltransferase